MPRLPPATRRRRDRRSRGLRGPLLPVGTPAARSRAERFHDLALEEFARVGRRFGAELAGVTVDVEDVPTPEVEDVRLFHLRAGTGEGDAGGAAQVVLHRRPLESRARGVRAREDLVRAVVVEAVAELLGLAPEDVDPDHDADGPS